MENEKQIDPTFSRQLKKIMSEKNLSNADVSRLMKVSRGMITNYLNMSKSPKLSTVKTLALALNVNPTFFFDDKGEISLDSAQMIEVVDTIKIPLYGSISCGDLTSIDNDLLEYIKVPADIKERYGDRLFAVIAKGESMNRRVPDGVTAVFAQDAQWENGDIVAVMVNGEEATMKHIHKTNSSIILEPNSYNPSFESTLISCNKVNCDDYVKVLGKLVYMHQKF